MTQRTFTFKFTRAATVGMPVMTRGVGEEIRDRDGWLVAYICGDKFVAVSGDKREDTGEKTWADAWAVWKNTIWDAMEAAKSAGFWEQEYAYGGGYFFERDEVTVTVPLSTSRDDIDAAAD